MQKTQTFIDLNAVGLWVSAHMPEVKLVAKGAEYCFYEGEHDITEPIDYVPGPSITLQQLRAYSLMIKQTSKYQYIDSLVASLNEYAELITKLVASPNKYINIWKLQEFVDQKRVGISVKIDIMHVVAGYGQKNKPLATVPFIITAGNEVYTVSTICPGKRSMLSLLLYRLVEACLEQRVPFKVIEMLCKAFL